MSRFLQKLLLAGSVAALLTPAAGLAQVRPDSIKAPKLQDNAAAAALFKNVKTAGEMQPDPKRPAGGNTDTAHPITNLVPVTCSMNGRQYLAVVAGGNGQGGGEAGLAPGIDQPGCGNMMYVFALPA